MNPSLLVELLTEELPPKALRTLGYSFAKALVDDLQNDGFVAADPAFDVFVTPRRLGLLIRNVAEKAPDSEVTFKGPSVKAGLGADGAPSQALLGFAKKQGVGPEQLIRIHDGKNEVFAYRTIAAGGLLDTNLELKVAAALERLPSPKMMRWGDRDEEFVRPVRGLVMLYGDRVVPGTVLSQSSGRTTRGHRFLGKGAIEIARADDYEALLERDGKVIANFELRARKIREELKAAAGGASIAAEDSLYDEVTALVEFPAVYEAHFEKAFLEVPQECLMLTMKQNQKYFPLVDGRGKLANRFLIVSNMAIAHPHHIVHGNERVLRARLADAKFFYDQDRRVTLASRVPGLAAVVYYRGLGSQLDRVRRLEILASSVASQLGADDSLARRAAHLAKADLLTGMVGEFPELQGLMGSYYAAHDGEPEPVVVALRDQYRLRLEGETDDSVNLTSASLYIADRLEALVGMFGVGNSPTGDKDPYGLRRAANGLISAFELIGGMARVAELRVPDVGSLLPETASLFPSGTIANDVPDQVLDFVLDRYRSQLGLVFPKQSVDAVITQRPNLTEIVARVRAVEAFRKLPEAESLAAANKRIRNILRKSEAVDRGIPDPKLFREDAERALHQALARIRTDVERKAAAGEYAESLRLLAQVRPEVDRFFDDVLVNAQDAALRTNRLRLLGELELVLNRVADISKLAA